MDQLLCAVWYTLRRFRRHLRDAERRGLTEWEALDEWCAIIGIQRKIGERTYGQMRSDIIRWLSEEPIAPIGRLWEDYKKRKEIAI